MMEHIDKTKFNNIIVLNEYETMKCCEGEE
jgi:hypothetical protein